MGRTRAKQQARAIVQDKSNIQDTCDAKQQAREKAIKGKVNSPGQMQMHKSRAKGKDKVVAA